MKLRRRGRSGQVSPAAPPPPGRVRRGPSVTLLGPISRPTKGVPRTGPAGRLGGGSATRTLPGKDDRAVDRALNLLS